MGADIGGLISAAFWSELSIEEIAKKDPLELPIEERQQARRSDGKMAALVNNRNIWNVETHKGKIKYEVFFFLSIRRLWN